MEASALNTVSIYAQDGQNYTFKKLLAEYQRYPDLCAAIKRNVPLIGESMPAIKLFIEHIPESVNGKSCIYPRHADASGQIAAPDF